MISVAYAHSRDLSPSELSQLPREERAREFGSAARRRQFLASRWLLRAMLSRLDGRPPRSFRIERSARGKPYCVDGPSFSVTHAGSYVACCVAESGAVGIDLEFVDADRPLQKLARRFFSGREAGWLDTQPADRFFMLWVLKEAYGKALGAGVVEAFRGLQCTVEPPRIAVFEPRRDLPSLRLLRLRDGYLAIAGIGAAQSASTVECWDAGRGEFVVDASVVEVASC